MNPSQSHALYSRIFRFIRVWRATFDVTEQDGRATPIGEHDGREQGSVFRRHRRRNRHFLRVQIRKECRLCRNIGRPSEPMARQRQAEDVAFSVSVFSSYESLKPR